MTKSITSLACIALLLVTAACTDGQTSAEHIAQAKSLMAEDQSQAAVIELKNALQKDNASAEARWLLGKLQLDAGQVAAAEKELRAAARLDWSADDVTPALAQALLAQQKFVQVRELPVEQLNSEARGATYAYQAMAEMAQGETEDALALIERARTSAPTSTTVMFSSARIAAARGELAQASDLLGEILAQDPKHAQAWALKGDIEMRAQRRQDALEAYGKAIDLQPEFYLARLRRALIYLLDENYPAAAEDAEVLARIAPRSSGSNYVQGLLLFQKKEYADAITALSQAEPAHRQFPMVLFYLGSAHLIEGNVDSAAGFAARFVELAPENIAGRKLLAMLRLQAEKYAEVETLLQPVLDANPDDLGAMKLLANALIKSGKTDEGIAVLARLAELQPDSAEARVQLGAGLLLSGDSSEAVHHIESALELNPEFQQADILLVLNHVRKQEYDAAITAAKAYVARNPVSVTPYNLLARVYLAAGRQSEAIETLNKALKIDPGDPGANQSLAQIAASEQRYDEALGYYATILEHHENALNALLESARLEARKGNEEAAVAFLQRAVDAHPTVVQPRLMLGRYFLSTGKSERVAPLFATLDNIQRQSPEVLQLLALAQLSDKSHIEAQQTLEQLLESNPENAGNHYLMAQAAAGAGDNERLLSELLRALELEPDHLPARLALARYYLAESEMENLEAQLGQLADRAPDDPGVLMFRGEVAYRQDDHASAIRLTRRAHELSPSDRSAQRLASYLDAGEDSEGAITFLRDWLAESPESTASQLTLGVLLGKSGQTAASLEAYRQVLKYQPANFVALNNLAWETRHSDPDQALKYARQAVQAAPENAAGLDTLAVVEFINGDYRAARRSIRKALDHAPDTPSLVYHAAMIDDALGDSAAAARTLQELLGRTTEFPEYEDAKTLLAKLEQ